MTHIPLKPCLMLLSLLMLLFVERAEAKTLCFQPPAGAPGLRGDPAWMSEMGDVVRKDLNEPRWSGPLRHFQSDLPGEEGLFRIQKNDDGTKLFIQIQTGADIGAPGPGDRAYFGISKTTSGSQPNPTAKGVRFIVGNTPPSENPKTSGLMVEGYVYDQTASPKWTNSSGVPGWVQYPAIWSKHPVVPVGSAVDWGVAFVVDLTVLGIMPTDQFKVVLGLNVVTTIGVSDVYTPPPPAVGYSGNNPFVEGFPVASWHDAAPTETACKDGVILRSGKLKVKNDVSSTTIDEIAVNPGAINTFQAGATLGSAPVPNGSLLAEFRIANWGTTASDGAYNPIAKNDGSTADKVPNQGSAWTFSCDANAGTKVCGLDPAPSGHQGIFARLNYATGFDDTNLPITKDSAYRNMYFVEVPKEEKYVAYAEINTKNIDTEKESNDIFLILHQRNMEPHQSNAVSLPYHMMKTTKREFFSPREAPLRGAAVAPEFGIKKSANYKKGAPKLTPEEREAALAIPTEVAPIDELEEVWPHLEVQAYFDKKEEIKNDAGTFKGLQAMFPFSVFYEPLQTFYGFTQEFSVEADPSKRVTLSSVSGQKAGEPEVLQLTIPKNETVKLKITTTFHREPLKSLVGTQSQGQTGDPAGTTTKDCPESDSWCSYAPRGWKNSGRGVVLVSLLTALWFVRRRRGQA